MMERARATPSADRQPPPARNLLLAADIQDALMSAAHDLGRLDGLLEQAVQGLMLHFSAVHGQLAQVAQAVQTASSQVDQPHEHLVQAMSAELRGAVTALQFQDMATQLIAHTRHQLRYCADQLASQAMDDDDVDGQPLVLAPPNRPNPVTQDEMDAGSVELF